MSKERVENNNNPPFTWQRLTPDEALSLGEEILRRIEEGSLNQDIYSPLVDRLITFADDPEKFRDSLSDSQPKSNETNTLSQNSSLDNKRRHQEGLSQLPPQERERYKKNRRKKRDILKTQKDGRPKVKNPKRKY